MNYQSTRGGGACRDTEAVLRGLAPDGGLYTPEAFPKLNVRELLSLEPMQLAAALLSSFLPSFPDMEELVSCAYAGKFSSPELTPLSELGSDLLLELYHGPTAAFKDVALSVLPRLIPAARCSLGRAGRTVILTATSGDTGKAALEGFCDAEDVRILVFYPSEGVSPIQRRQMQTQRGGNVSVCAVEGNFDDCQRAVKEAFTRLNGDEALSSRGITLSSANSINIGRLAPQLYYYFYAYAELLRRGRISFGQTVDFIVPTGNFGDILAGWFAKELGLPIGKLVCASNANRVLTDLFESGVYDVRRDFYKTESPSMDILVSSNLERLLWLVSGRDSALVTSCMTALAKEGHFRFPEEYMSTLRRDFAAYACTEEECRAAIRSAWEEHRRLIDPHTAVGYHALGRFKAEQGKERVCVLLSTASPFKFPAAVLTALGAEPECDEFARLRQLERVSGERAPAALSGLETLPILHKDRIKREDILKYVLDKVVEA